VTCEEFKAMIRTPPWNVLPSELLAAAAHFESCDACRLPMQRAGADFQERCPSAAALSSVLGKQISKAARAAVSEDPELRSV
jgi:hypothetical protein